MLPYGRTMELQNRETAGKREEEMGEKGEDEDGAREGRNGKGEER